MMTCCLMVPCLTSADWSFLQSGFKNRHFGLTVSKLSVGAIVRGCLCPCGPAVDWEFIQRAAQL